MRNALLVIALAVATATAQTPPPPDASKLDEETLRHFQALVRMDTSDPPGNEQPAAEYLKKVLEADGIPAEILALEPRRPNVVARLKGSGKKRPAPHHGAHRCRQRRSEEVDPSALQRDARRRVYLRPWDGGRQGQSRRRPHGDAHAQAAERAARSRRHLSRRVRRGGFDARRHPVHDRPAFPEDRRRVLPRRRRERVAGGRSDQVRSGPDAREDSPRHRADGARHLGARVGPAAVKRRRAPRRGRGEGRRLEAADQAERHDARLLQAAGVDLVAGGCETVPRRHRRRRRGGRGGRRPLPPERAAARVDAEDIGVADDHPGGLSHQRHPLGSQGDARRAHPSRREPGRLPGGDEESHQRSRR